MKKFFKFLNATILFVLVMNIAISIYTKFNGIEEPYEDQFLFWLDYIVGLVGSLCIIGMAFLVMRATQHYVHTYESPKDAIKMFHSSASISWVQVQYDEEGEEIKRDKYAIEIFHNMARTDNDGTLDVVVEQWHVFKRNNDLKDNNTAQDFCDFVNVHTNYVAAPTKEEFITMLKGRV